MLNQTTIQKPTKVTRAHTRMSEAVSRLENAMRGRSETLPDASVEPLPSPNSFEESSELSALEDEIKQLRQENKALKRVHEQVSARLDAAIERLSATIGEKVNGPG